MSEPTFDKVLRVEDPSAGELVERGVVRIEEVARIARVSPITVSRALRKPEMVSALRRERIMKAVKETGYSSNPHAKALKSGQSPFITAFVSNILSEQFSLAVEGLSDVLEPAGFQVTLNRTSYSYRRETTLVRSLTALRPAAVFITGVMELESNRTFLRNMGVPIMESWALAPDPIDMLVGFSNADGARMVAEHFAEKGYRKVAFIGRSGGRGLLRLNSFAENCERLGLDLCRRISRDIVSGVPEGRRALHDLLSDGGSVEAVFCASDLLAIGALLEARSRGMQMPDDIAIAGFGDSVLAREIMPGLTTVASDTRILGEIAGKMILQRLQRKNTDQDIRNIPLRLIERGST